MARKARGRVRDRGSSSNDAWGRRGGKEGLARADQERKKAAERSNFGPWRFGLDKGDEREIIILDASVDDFWYMYEHTYYNKSDKPPVKHFPCSREFEECPICEEASANQNGPYNPSAWTIFLTVLELHDDDPYEDRDGVEHFYSKRLLAVKATQATELERIFEIVEKKEGGLRGLCLLMSRDEGKQSIRIGKPVMNDDGEMYSFYSDDELIDEFGHDAVVKDGKTVREEDWDITPYDYAKLFPKPTASAIAEQTGLELPAGSAAAIQQELDEDDEEEGTSRRRRSGGKSRRRGRAAQETTGARRRSRSRRASEEEDEDQNDEDQQDEQEEDEQEEERRPRSRSRSRPRARSREEEPEDDEQEEEEPPRRSRTRTRSRASSKKDDAPKGRSRSRGRRASADDIPM